MLQINAGSMWIGQKVMEKIREESPTNQRRNFLVKITLDKVSYLSKANKRKSNYLIYDIFVYFIASSLVFDGCHTISNILHSRFNL